MLWCMYCTAQLSRTIPSIRRVSYVDILADPHAQELIGEYAAECSIPAIGRIEPQIEMYRALEESGMMRCFGVYDGNTLVGFASVLISILPHYGRKVATVESLFVASAHRPKHGKDLLKTLETDAAEADCEAILYSARAGSQLELLLLLKSAYRFTNSVFCRRLN